jgi:PAS domain S-box-containing protein
MNPEEIGNGRAFAAISMDILSNVLSRASSPADVGDYVTEEICELTGARCVILIQYLDAVNVSEPRIISVNPPARRKWAESSAGISIFEYAHCLQVPQLLGADAPSEITGLLKQQGFGLSMALPLNAGAFNVGAMLLFGLPDNTQSASAQALLNDLATILALVLRNSFLFDYQEQTIRERTMELQKANERLQIEITESRRVEEALRKNEEKYRLLFENMAQGIIFHNADGTLEDCNPEAPKMLGLTREQFLSRTAVDPLWQFIREDGSVLPVEERPAMIALKTGQSVRDVVVGVCNPRTDDCVWLNVSAIPLFKPGEKMPYQAFVTMHNITERKQLEELLRSTSRYTRSLIEASLDPLVTISSDGKITDVNAATETVTGYSRAQLVGTDFSDYFTEPEKALEGYREVFRKGSVRDYPLAIQRRDGQVTYVVYNAAVYQDERGQVVGVFAAARDITERKKAESELQRSEKRKSILNRIADIFLTSSDDDIYAEVLELVLMNLESPYGIFGFIDANGDLVIPSLTRGIWDQCQVPGKSIVFPAETWGHSLWGQAIREKKLLCSEGPFHVPQGHLKIDRFISAPIVYQDKTIGLISLANKEGSYTQEERDVLGDIVTYIAPILNARLQRDQQEVKRRQSEEEKLKLEEQLRHVQRLESIGTLAGGIAHDFNNILNVITGFAHIIKMRMAPDDPNNEFIRDILVASERAAELTKSLLIFSRKQITELKPLSINDLVKGMQKMIFRIIGEDIETHIELSPVNLVVMGDYGQLEQVLMNLVTNARDAMPGGGSLFIETKTHEIDAEFSRMHGFGKPGKYALIIITDSGSGMDEKTRDKIFEPFYTTKEVGKGTGLGLSIVYGIVKQHNGYINCYSEPGKGTTFKIYLPVIEDTARETEELPIVAAQYGTETILIAEDDLPSRKITKHLLESCGYTIIEAHDGADVVSKFTENMGRIDLLLLDVIMPKKSGMDALDEIRKTHPDVKALFISGYIRDAVDHKMIIDGKLPLIQKPVKPAELLSKIREALDNKT